MLLLSYSTKSLKLRMEISKYLDIPLKTTSKSELIEHMGVSVRFHTICASMWLLDSWPNRYVEFCKKVGLTKSWIFHDKKNPPYWFWSVVNQKLNKGFYEVNVREVNEAVNYLERSNRKVTKSGLKRLLGRDATKAIGKYFDLDAFDSN